MPTSSKYCCNVELPICRLCLWLFSFGWCGLPATCTSSIPSSRPKSNFDLYRQSSFYPFWILKISLRGWAIWRFELWFYWGLMEIIHISFEGYNCHKKIDKNVNKKDVLVENVLRKSRDPNSLNIVKSLTLVVNGPKRRNKSSEHDLRRSWINRQ